MNPEKNRMVMPTCNENNTKNPHIDVSWCLVTVLASIVLTTSALLALLVPLDIGFASSTVDLNLGLKYPWATPSLIQVTQRNIEFMYHTLIFLQIVIIFVAIPWVKSSFSQRNEEVEDEDDSDKVDNFLEANGIVSSWSAPISGTILLIIILIGAYMSLPLPSQVNLPWYNALLLQSGTQKAMSLLFAGVLVVSLDLLLFRLSAGLSYLPIYFFKKPSQDKNEQNQVLSLIQNLNNLNAAIHDLEDKDNLSRKDKSKLTNLEEERDAVRQEIEALRESSGSASDKKENALPRILRLCSIPVAAFSFLVFLSVLVNLADKFSHTCGSSCRYLLTSIFFTTPLDGLFLTLLNNWFTGLVFFSFSSLIIISGGIVSVERYGNKILSLFSLGTISRGKTDPKSYLNFVASIGLMIPAWLLLAFHMLPTYINYGTQQYCSTVVNGIRDCSMNPYAILTCQISSPQDICTPSVLATLLSRIHYVLPGFATIFYFSEWIFLIFSVAAMFINMKSFKSKSKFDEEEARSLLE